MKKMILICTLCLLLLCITACGNTDRGTATFGNTMEFASSEEMLKHVEGMWLVGDNKDEKSYYIFRDNQVYITTDAMYSAQVKNMLNSALKNGGLKALLLQNFSSVSKRMYLEDFTLIPQPVIFLPENGEIKLHHGESTAESIIITDDSVTVKSTNAESSSLMTKISDTTDFSAECFEEIFNEVWENYTVPSSYFWTDPMEYGEIVKTMIPQFSWWTMTTSGECEIYTPHKDLTPVTGSSLILSPKSLTFVYKMNINSWDNKKPTLLIEYTPADGSFNVLNTNNSSLNLLSLVQYGVYTVESFPGAYTDPLDLYNALADAESEYSGSTETKELTANGLTYTLCVGADGSWGQFTIKANKTILLDDVLKSKQEMAETETSHTQNGTLEQLLDGTKSWVGQWEYDGWEYSVHFVFKEDGTCYFALSDMELFGAGKGTYTVNSDKTLSVKIRMDGKEHVATYAFDPDAFSLTVISDKGLVAKKGDVFNLQEDLVNDVEKIENWGEALAEGTIDDEDSPWG